MKDSPVQTRGLEYNQYIVSFIELSSELHERISHIHETITNTSHIISIHELLVGRGRDYYGGIYLCSSLRYFKVLAPFRYLNPFSSLLQVLYEVSFMRAK